MGKACWRGSLNYGLQNPEGTDRQPWASLLLELTEQNVREGATTGDKVQTQNSLSITADGIAGTGQWTQLLEAGL